MNILIIGSGGREHTFAWKIRQSPKCDQLFVAPGNAGTASLATNIDISGDDFPKIADFIKDENIEMLVVGPEGPLVKGIRNYFEEKPEFAHLTIIGPGKLGAQLEGSKDFSKAFMNRHNIPAGKSRTFTVNEIDEAILYLDNFKAPYVLKADGLAAGKGVIIAQTKEAAVASLKEMLINQQFGEASSKVLVEQFLDGIELSIFVLSDGDNFKVLPAAKDYKRIGDGDTGLNTGGMGAASPVVFADHEFLQKVEDRIIKPTIDGLRKDKIPFSGFLFIGLMNCGGDPYVIEYNVRMGDPETQVVLPRINSDLVEMFQAVGTKSLNKIKLDLKPDYATTVVMVAGGYPEAYQKGNAISGLNKNGYYQVFHAGTAAKENEVVTNGGRVLAITGMGKTLGDALNKSYTGVDNISWQGENHRTDIGQDLLNY